MVLLLPELVKTITSSLDQRDIYECMITCKHLYSALSYAYLHKIELNEKQQQKFLEFTKQTRVDGNKVGLFLQHLHFYDTYSYQKLLCKEEFLELIHNLPNVVRITFDAEDTYTTYLEYLQKVPLSDMQRIREISYSRKKRYLYCTIKKGCLHANLRFRDRITHLKFWHLSTKERFNRLKHLSIICLRQSQTLTGLLNEYSEQLCSFELDLVYHWDREMRNQVVLKNLTSLKLGCVPELPKQPIDYIMTCMPNLQVFHISRAQCPILKILTLLDIDTLNRFKQYLKRVNQVTLRSKHVGLYRLPQDLLIRDKLLLAFIQEICPQDSFCNLKVQFTHTSSSFKDDVVFEKHGRAMDITTVWLMNIFTTHELWTKRLDFLIFTSIVIINLCPQIYAMYPHLDKVRGVHNFLIQPIIALLEREKQERITCPLFIRNFKQRMFFYPSQDRDDFPLYDGCVTEKSHVSGMKIHSKVDFGYVQKLLLTDDLLRSLGRLYPFVEHLTFVNCLFEDKQRTKQYHIDLTLFKDIHQFTFDFDAMSKKKFKRPLYIILTNSEARTCYYFNERIGILQHVDSSVGIDQPATVIKVSYTRIRQFTFRRHKKNIMEIK